MKKILCISLSIIFSFLLISCSNKSSNPETVAAVNVEAWFEHDFEVMLETYPKFRLSNRAVSFGESRDSDVKTVAAAMNDYFESDGREVEILSTKVLEQNKIDDFSMYSELKEKYEDITTDDFDKITETATVRVDFTLEDKVLDSEIKCIKMDKKWYVLADDAFTD